MTPLTLEERLCNLKQMQIQLGGQVGGDEAPSFPHLSLETPLTSCGYSGLWKENVNESNARCNSSWTPPRI